MDGNEVFTSSVVDDIATRLAGLSSVVPLSPIEL